jgi:hypothetical protein
VERHGTTTLAIQSRAPRRRCLVYSFAATVPTSVDSFFGSMAASLNENPKLSELLGIFCFSPCRRRLAQRDK